LLDNCGDNFDLIIPDDDVINFKEALIFAFLGVLRSRGEVNCLKSVTGAETDSSGGILVGF
jgi:anhydro-N-acetylmuramic acid kinase